MHTTNLINLKKKTQNYPKYNIHVIFAAMGFFLGSQERVRNSRGKRAISVRVTEIQLFWFQIGIYFDIK